MENKVIVTWKMVEDYIDNVAKRLDEEGLKPSGIFTFPRGGLILATLLSYKTGLPLLSNPAKNCVIIDDICDTGITLKKYSELAKEKGYFITTMYCQIDQLAETANYQCFIDYFEEKKEYDWIVFPWEGEDKEC